MTQYFELVKRNMRVYLRDRAAVFFSLLSMVIVLALMLFFLGDSYVNAITEALAHLPGRDAALDAENATMFILQWTCAGIVSINAVTVTMAVYSTMIKDRTDGRLGAIYTAPISRLTISASYVTAAWLCSVIICLLTLAISEIYCIIEGGEPFSFLTHLKLVGMIAVNSFTYAALMYLAAMLIQTEGAWSGIGTVIGTLVGFLGGIYLPIGQLAEPIAVGMKCLPVIYGTKLFRSIMVDEIGKELFADAPDALTDELYQLLGVELDCFGIQVSNAACVALLALCGLLFLLAGAWVTKTAKKRNK